VRSVTLVAVETNPLGVKSIPIIEGIVEADIGERVILVSCVTRVGAEYDQVWLDPE